MSVRSVLLATTILSGVGGLWCPLTAHAGDASGVKAGPALKPPSVHDTVFNAYASARPHVPVAPAVDGLNWKADVLGGSIGHQSIGGVRGVVAMPVGNQFGLQFDVQAGALGGYAFGNVVGRYFWRDPASKLFGIHVSQTAWNRFGGVYATHISPEFEFYWGRWTFRGLTGIEFGNSGSRSDTITTAAPGGGGGGGVLTTVSTFTEGYDVKTRFFDQIDLKYYFTDNWMGYVGHRYLGGKHALALGTEYALGMRGGKLATIFAEGRAGQGAFEGLWGGLRVYLGKDKSLIRRHREDDPLPWDTLFSILNTYSNSGSTSSSLFCPDGLSGGANPGGCEL